MEVTNIQNKKKRKSRRFMPISVLGYAQNLGEFIRCPKSSVDFQMGTPLTWRSLKDQFHLMNTKILKFLGFLVSWFLGFVVLWFCGFVVSWFRGFLVSLFRRFLVSWFLGCFASSFQSLEVSQIQKVIHITKLQVHVLLKDIGPILSNFHFICLIGFHLTLKISKSSHFVLFERYWSHFQDFHKY